MNPWSGQIGQLRSSVQRLSIATVALVGLIVADPANVWAGGHAPAEELIHQLGSQSFRLREQAENELRQLGVDVLPVLQDASGDRNLEVRFRVRRLMQSIEHQHQLRLLNQFLTDYDPELAQQLAGWSRYAELVGDDVDARRLFVAMYEAEPELMSLVGRASTELRDVLEARTLDLQPPSGRRPTTTTVPAASTATLLFVSLDPSAQAGSRTKSTIHKLVKESTFLRATKESTNPPTRRLLGTWVSLAADVHPSIRMSIGNYFDLAEAVQPALELIDSRIGSSQIQQAVFTVARFGTVEQIPVLERLFEDDSVLAELQRGEEETFTCQVRDVALVAAVHVIGKHPAEFGFQGLRANANSLYALNTAGFNSEERRSAAFRLWALWCNVQRHQFRALDETAVEGITL